MPTYDGTLFDPPAPVAHVVLRDPQLGTTVADVPLLIDLGADVTLIPRDAVLRLGTALIPGVEHSLVGFDGSVSRAAAVHLGLIFLRRTFRGRYLLIDQDWGVLGRDILNLLTLCFDGPKLQWHDQRPLQR